MKNLFSQGFILIVSLLFANVCNFLFNAYLGRALSFEEFGLVTIVTTIWNLINIPLGSLGASVNHRVAFLQNHDGDHVSAGFTRSILKKTGIYSMGFSLLWFLCVPFLANFFQVPPFVLWHMTPIFVVGTALFVVRGYFSGVAAFTLAGFLIALDAFIKLLLGVGLSASPWYSFTYIAIPVSVGATCILAFIVFYQKQQRVHPEKTSYRFPRRFFIASLVSGFAVTAFLSFDVMLAKHYLDPVKAGQYALLSLVGKIVFFFGSLLNALVITYLSRDIALGKDTQGTFYKFLIGVVALSIFAFTVVGVFGDRTVPLFFGQKSLVILPYVLEYSLAITLFAIAGYIVLYHLTKHHYSFSLVPLAMSGAIIVGIYAFHDSIGSITRVLFVVSCLNFFLTCALHFLQRNGRFVLANLIDLFDVFLPLFDRKKKIDPSKKRILIMNWRDTRHKFAGGAEVYVHELAKRWVKEGHSVTLFCGNDSESLRNEVIDGMQIIRRGGFYFVYVWAFVYYFTKFRGCYDVIIDCHNGIPFFTPLYVKERVICVVHHVHQDVFLAHLTLPFAFLARVLENRLMPLVYKDIEFVAVSSSTKDDMIRWGILGKGIHIIPNGIDDNLYVPSSKSKAPFIVYVGRLKYYKSVNIFIHAAVSVHKKFPRAKFVIAGDGEERRGLQNLVEQLGATSFIEFKGKVSEQEKIFLYQQAWVFVNPSRIEGWGLTTIEANACGTPVVASRVSGLCDSVVDGKSGILVDYGDIDGFSDAICLLIRDKKLRQRMEAFSVDWAKKFRWDDSARLFMDVIKNIEINKNILKKGDVALPYLNTISST